MHRLFDKLNSQSDSLIIVKFISSTIYQFYFTKVALIFFLIVQLSCQLIQVYLFINELNAVQFIQYSPAFFMMFYPILATIILLINPKLIEKLSEEVNLWPIEFAAESTKIKIRNEMKIISLFTIINTIGSMSIGLACFFFNSYDYTMFLPVKYFIDYHPKYSNILVKIYKASLTFSASTTFIAHSYQVVYYTQHLKYQCLMLIDRVDGIIIEKENSVQEILIDDREYQQQVKLKLINHIRRHQELLTSGHKKIIEISNYIAYFGVCGLLVFTSVIYVFVMNSSISYYDYRYLPFLCLGAVTTTAAPVIAGQSIETMSDNSYYLLQQIEWYHMDNENRKLYLMLLLSSERKIAIKFSENYSINFALGLAIVRGAYSVMSVLASFK